MGGSHLNHAATSWADRALEQLRAAGYRTGSARREVIGFLETQSCCLGAQEIHDWELTADQRLVTRRASAAEAWRTTLPPPSPHRRRPSHARLELRLRRRTFLSV